MYIFFRLINFLFKMAELWPKNVCPNMSMRSIFDQLLGQILIFNSKIKFV